MQALAYQILSFPFRFFCTLCLKLQRFSQRRPFIIVMLTLSIVAYMAMGLPQLSFLFSANDFLDSAFKSPAAYKKARLNFRVGNTVLIVFSPKDPSGFREKEVCQIHRWVVQQGLRTPNLRSVNETLAYRRPQFKDGKLRYPLVFDLNCAKPDSELMAYASFLSLKSTPLFHALTDRDGKDLSAEFLFSDQQMESRSFDPNVVGEMLASLSKEFPPATSSITFHALGIGAFQWFFKSAMEHDALLNLAMLAIIVIFFRIFFGTWRGGLMVVLTQVLMGIVVFGGMGWTGTPVDPLSNSILLLVSIAALQDFLFLSHDAMHSKQVWKSTYRRLLIPSFFTTFTTMIGFGSLGISDLAAIRQFGYWAAIGVFVEWFLIFYFLPALSVYLKPLRYWTDAKRAIIIPGIETSVLWTPSRWLTVVALIAIVPAFAAFRFIEINDKPQSAFPKGHLSHTSIAHVLETRGWQTVAFLHLDRSVNDHDLRTIAAKWRTQQNVEAIELHLDIIEDLTKDIPGQYQELVARSIKSNDFWSRYVGRDGSKLIALYLKESGIAAVEQMRRDASDLCKPHSCELLGDQISFVEFCARILPSLLESFILSMLLVTIVLAYLSYCLRVSGAFSAIVSALWAPAIMIGVFAIFRVDMNLISSIFTAVLVGLTGDNAIQYFFSSKHRHLTYGIKQRGGGSILITVLMTMATLTLLFSDIAPTRELGVLFILGFWLLLLGDLWLLSGFMQLFSINKRDL